MTASDIKAKIAKTKANGVLTEAQKTQIVAKLEKDLESLGVKKETKPKKEGKPKTPPKPKEIRKYKGKNIEELDEAECDELRKEVAARRKKQSTSEKKSKSRPVIEKVASNFATAAKQIINNIPAADIKDDPKGEINKMQKVEAIFKKALADVRNVLGTDYDKETVDDEFAEVHKIIVELKKKYA